MKLRVIAAAIGLAFLLPRMVPLRRRPTGPRP